MQLEGMQVGRYHFIRKLGSGGMGEVYLAEDERIGQQVAIKVIRSEAAASSDTNTVTQATRLFQREAMAIARLDHPHILPLFDYGEAKIDTTTLNYLVMPFRREGSLADWLRRRNFQPLSLQDVAYIVSQAADALQHSHDRQIIHQDVKPSNMLIREKKDAPNRPDVLLTDFGIAKFTSANAMTSQVIRGTPAYMAPEQWAGHPVPATDQYALAIMVYELLAGRAPFQGGSMQMMYQHLNVQPQLPSMLNTDLPADVDAVLLYALAKDPSRRFGSIAVFAHAFQQSVQNSGSSSATRIPATPSTPRITNEDEMYAVLAISEAEALRGTYRMVILPGGQRVTVPVPAGTQDGHLVRLEGSKEQPGSTGSTSTLTFIIAVKQTDEVFPTGSMAETTPTVMISSNPDVAKSISDSNPTERVSNTPPFISKSQSNPHVVLPFDYSEIDPNALTSSTLLSAPEARATNAIPMPLDASETQASAFGGLANAGQTQAPNNVYQEAREGDKNAPRRKRIGWLVIVAALFALALAFGGATFAMSNLFHGNSSIPLAPQPTQVPTKALTPTATRIPPIKVPGLVSPTATHISPTATRIPPTATSIPPTATPFPSPTQRPTATPTPVPSPSPTPVPSPTPSPTPIPSPTPSPTPVPSPTPSPIPTPSPTALPTATPAVTPAPSPTP